MGFIDFTNGEVLTAGQMDETFRQTVMRFANASARDTALSEVLAEGMMAYLDDTNEVLKYDGTSWIDISGDITGVTAGTALTGGGTSGNVTLDVDTSVVQPNVITTQGDLVIGDASGDPVRLPVGSADQVLTSDGTTVSFQDAGGGGGFNAVDIITSSNSSYSIPALASDIIKVTVIGGGGGGMNYSFTSERADGGTGGNSSVTGAGLTTITSSGGQGAKQQLSGVQPVASWASYNGGRSWNETDENYDPMGGGGEIKTAYLNVAGLSTLDITVGAGGSGPFNAKPGFRGEVILEYVSA